MNKQELRVILGNNIKKYREMKGYSKVELTKLISQKLGEQIDSSYFTHWEAGRYSPTPDTLKAICDILDVSLSQMYGEEDTSTKDEECLIQNYRRLDLRQKQIAQAVIKTQLGLSNGLVVKTIKLYNQSACAGNGHFVDSEDYELIEVSNPPINADFAIRVQGKSMQPVIEDERIIYVQSTKQLRDGDVGIFCYQGNVYCKQLREHNKGIQLVSFNKEYQPVLVENIDEFYIIGKVL